MKNLIIFDADSILFATAFAMNEHPLSEAIRAVDDFVLAIANSCSAEEILLCITEGKSWRKQYAKTKEYKGNRKFRELPKHLNDLRDHLKQKWKAFYVPHWEADDLIFIAKTEYESKYPDRKIYLATNDKDCLQYPGDFVDFKKMKFFTLSKEEALKNLWTQMITGDPGDNIPGIEGLGIKAAEKAFMDKSPDEYPQIVLNLYLSKYPEFEAIERFYESYKLLKLVNNCREAGLEKYVIPEPLKVDYNGHSILSEGSSQDSEAS